MKINFNTISFKSGIFPNNHRSGKNVWKYADAINENKIDFSNPEEQKYDIQLGTEIQKLKKEILQLKLNIENTQNELEKEHLSKRIQILEHQKDIKVKELTGRHLFFALKVASKYNSYYNPNEKDDIISDANIGLIRAAEKFDPIKQPNVPFVAYAKWWIKQQINKNMKTYQQIYIPIQTQQNHKKLIKAENDLTEKLGRKPTIDEIKKFLGRKNSTYLEILKQLCNIKHIPLDSPISEDSDVTVANFVADERSTFPILQEVNDETKCALKKIMQKRLLPKEREVLTIRYKLNESNPEDYNLVPIRDIAKIVGLTRERIRQLEAQGIEKLRKAAEENLI